jgi:hypothetical protein
MTGRTQPYQSLIIASAVGVILGFLLLVVALVADMLNRLRKLLEELLYLARRRHYAQAPAPEDETRSAFIAAIPDTKPAPPKRGRDPRPIRSDVS